MLPSWSLGFFSGDVLFALESEEHGLLASLVYSAVDDVRFVVLSALASFEEAGLNTLHPTLQ